MTTDRALKQDIRKRRAKTGESYSDAARWIKEAGSLPVFIAARPHANGGRRFHALRQPEAGSGNRIIFYGRSLCGLRATDSMGSGGWRSLIPHDLPDAAVTIANPNGAYEYVAFDPDVVFTGAEACPACARVLREQFQPDSRTKKQCATCGQTKPLNKFRQNRSSADGYAKTCEQCRRDALDASARVAEARHLAERLAGATAAAERWTQVADAYQADGAAVPTFRCGVGHALTLIAKPTSHELGLTWTCACGEASFTATHRAAISAYNDLARLRETAGQVVEMA